MAAQQEQSQVIGHGNSGDVIRQGNYILKNSTNQEGQIYSALYDIEGIAKGQQIADKIQVPYYSVVISIDTVKKPIRERLAHLVYPNITRINSAVAQMSNRGIIYNDPLQFGLGDSMDLLDFSNARYADADIDRTSDDSPVMRNYSDLSRFYSTFGLGHISERISKGIRWFDLMQDREMLTDMIDFIEDGKDVLTTLDNLGSTPKAVYYASNARAVQLPNIAQTPHNGDYLLVFSLEPLTAEQIDEYELTPIYQA